MFSGVCSVVTSMIRSDHRWNWARSLAGTPSISAITSSGSRAANPSTKSTGFPVSMSAASARAS